MRGMFACVLLATTAVAGGTAFAQGAPAKCENPNALGVSRTVEIDTTGGPGFGFEHFKQHDFLRNKEVVLTFDDGPWPTTPAGAEGARRPMRPGDVLHRSASTPPIIPTS